MIQLEEFRAWLKTKHQDAPVGRTGQGRICPITTYLKTLHPPETYVYASHNASGGAFCCIGSKKHEHRLPRWCARFMRTVDAALGNYPVPALMALKFLEKAEDPDGERDTL